MRLAIVPLALLLTCLAIVSAAVEERPARLVVDGRLVTGSALHEVRVVLNDGKYTAIPRQDGSFVFLTVAPGSYLLEVHDVHNVWPMVRVDVSAKSSGKIRAMLTHTKDPLALPITLEPVLVKPQWFEVRPPFQWTSMLMNPMVMMMGVTLLIMFAMPKMMANMDPEQLEEMKQMQGSMGGSWKDMLDPEKLKEKQQALQQKEKGGSKKKNKD